MFFATVLYFSFEKCYSKTYQICVTMIFLVDLTAYQYRLLVYLTAYQYRLYYKYSIEITQWPISDIVITP